MSSLPPSSPRPPSSAHSPVDTPTPYPDAEPQTGEPEEPRADALRADALRADDQSPWRVWMAPAGVALGLGLGVVATIVVEVLGSAGGSSLTHPSPAVSIVGDIAFDLGFVAAALYFASVGGRASAADFGFRRIRLGTAVKAIVLGVVGYYGLTAVYSSIVRLKGTDKLPSDLGVSHGTAALAAAAVFVCVIAPIAEEIFFRGFFFGALRKWRIEVAGRDIGTWVAAVLTGILFGLAHTGSASSQYLIPLGFLGFVLCIMRWKTGSLYPCIVLHSANNALALGVNQLSWNAVEIIALILASWLVIAAITGPLGARSPRIA